MTRWTRIGRGLTLFLVIGYLLALHMLLLAASRPVIREVGLRLAGWPHGAPPLRIALLSDIHTSSPSDPPARVAAIVRIVNAARPDLILLAGDFLGTNQFASRRYSVAQSIAPLAALHAPLGVLAVPGNHDRFFRSLGAVRAALAQAGIPLLVNQVVRRGPLAILGLDDYATGHRDVPGVLAQWRRQSGLAVALTHDPAILLRLPADAVGVRLAGHTHCGQISPPPFGALVSGTVAGMRYVCGLVREPGGRVTIVGGGLGTSTVPMRLGAAPELWMITLGPATP